jgi:hypothetical protein
MHWFLRVSRSLGWRRTVLHRRSDLAEGYIVTGLLAVFLLLAPLAGVLAGRWADHAGLRDQRQQHGWRQVTATLLAPAPGEISAEGWSVAPARWTAPDGAARSGMVPALSGTQAGGHARIWVTAAGWTSGQPLSRSQVQVRTAAAAGLAVIALTLALGLLAAVAHILLHRRRLAGWDTAWAATGPRWSQRRHP